jgi:dipeptidyl aminopeptidase/acylaminoacyl peptidase
MFTYADADVRREENRMRGLPSALIAVGMLCVAGFASSHDAVAAKEPARASDSHQPVHAFSQVSIAPDGQSVVWSEVETGGETSAKPLPRLYVADLRAPANSPRQITAGKGKDRLSERDPVWSPDGRHIAFLSGREESREREIDIVAAAGGPARQVTKLKADLSNLAWSPDGKEISYLFIEHAPRAAGPTAAVPPQTGVIGESPFEQRLGTVDVARGTTRTLSPADLYVYEYAWSPDGRAIALIAAHGSGDNNWYLARIFVLAPQSGALSPILKPAMQIAVPSWSPDGKSIAFIGGLMSDEGQNGGDIYSVPAAGGTPRRLTPGLKASPSWLSWLPSGRILFTEHVDGGSGIGSLDPENGRVESLWTGGEAIAAETRSRISITRDGKTSALVRQSFERPPEIWAGPLAAWRPVTHANAHRTANCGRVRSLHWKSDPFTVQGWLLFPKDYQKARRYPMVTIVHGGPASQAEPNFPSPRFPQAAEFSRRGYFVFLPNPRGSYGQGEEFTRANVKNLGYGDLRDVLSGVDEILKTLPVDKERLGIAGWSYGGFMTMWAVTQTGRFRAAVAGAGIANWQSYYGQNGIDQWVIPYFGATLYDDPAIYAKSSPINFIKQARTPTLILVGEYDAECPAAQSFEFWHALKTLGVPNEFVVYPKEGHRISEPAHERDIMKRMTGWFDKYLGESGPPASR